MHTLVSFLRIFFDDIFFVCMNGMQQVCACQNQMALKRAIVLPMGVSLVDKTCN
jgi:hypothetical protein